MTRVRLRSLIILLSCGVSTLAAQGPARPAAPPRADAPGTQAARSVRTASSAKPSPVTVTVAGPLHPGSLALVSVTAAQPILAVDATAFGRPVTFWESEWHDAWQGFAGVGLDVKAGSHQGSVTVTLRDGSIITSRAVFAVAPRTFETRRLKVDTRFAQPPQEEADRIQRDARLLAGLFAQVTPSRLWRGRFEPPVPGRATSSFGRLSVLNGQPGSRHLGTDFVAANGVAIQSPNAGVVVMSGELYFSGNTVIVDHGAGLFSLFAHLSRIDVTPGTRVATGTTLGLTGSTGRVTGPHLHWAVRLGDVSVDPMSLLDASAESITPPRP